MPFSGLTPKSDFAKVASRKEEMASFPPSLFGLTPHGDFAKVAAEVERHEQTGSSLLMTEPEASQHLQSYRMPVTSGGLQDSATPARGLSFQGRVMSVGSTFSGRKKG